ncbi:hypothetical protein KFS98_003600 [Salmonella enterica]|nr:hypothetical protein [Salmonella enterica]
MRKTEFTLDSMSQLEATSNPFKSNGLERFKRSLEVLVQDEASFIRVLFDYQDFRHQVVAWREVSGEFGFSVILASALEANPDGSPEDIYKEGYSPLDKDPLFAEKIEQFYSPLTKDARHPRHVNLGFVDSFLPLVFQHITSGEANERLS